MRKRRILLLFLLSLIFIAGCSNQQSIESFSLMEIHRDSGNEGTPTSYIVSPKGYDNRVHVLTSEISLSKVEATPPVEYEIERAEVTEDEIILEFNDEILTFERLSSTVAQDPEGVQYQYISHEEGS